MNKVLIMVAPNGARLTKADHPALPITPQELAAEAEACLQAGAAAMHLHVRDAHGAHSLDSAHYGQALDAVREAVGQGMVLQITTEAAGIFGIETQMRVVRELRPEAVSIALREFLPEDADDARRKQVAGFFGWMAEAGIAPQIILYAPAEVARLARLVEQGIMPWDRPFLLFVLGRYGGEAATPEMLEGFLDAFAPLRGRAAWMACAFGPRQIDVLAQAARRGGHVRIGFENGREIAPGQTARDNAELVHALVNRLAEDSHAPMPSASARALMGLR